MHEGAASHVQYGWSVFFYMCERFTIKIRGFALTGAIRSLCTIPGTYHIYRQVCLVGKEPFHLPKKKKSDGIGWLETETK